jgi:hypothetical protein
VPHEKLDLPDEVTSDISERLRYFGCGYISDAVTTMILTRGVPIPGLSRPALQSTTRSLVKAEEDTRHINAGYLFAH